MKEQLQPPPNALLPSDDGPHLTAALHGLQQLWWTHKMNGLSNYSHWTYKRKGWRFFFSPLSKLLHTSVTTKQTIAICRDSVLLAGRRGGVQSALRRGLSCWRGCSGEKQLKKSAFFFSLSFIVVLWVLHTSVFVPGSLLEGNNGNPNSQDPPPALGRMGRVKDEPRAEHWACSSAPHLLDFPSWSNFPSHTSAPRHQDKECLYTKEQKGCVFPLIQCYTINQHCSAINTCYQPRRHQQIPHFHESTDLDAHHPDSTFPLSAPGRLCALHN